MSTYLDDLDHDRLPNHVGIVMDLGSGGGSAETLIAEAHAAVTA